MCGFGQLERLTRLDSFERTHEQNEVSSSTAETRWSAVWIVAAIVLVFDQLTKAVISSWLGRDAEAHRWELLGRWVGFEYVENTGAAFGILAGQPVLLSAIAIVVTFVFLVIMREESGSNSLLLIAVGLVLGGALGNLVDRLRLGFVVDYIAVGIWPRFNVADSAIMAGLGMMAWAAIADQPQTQHGGDELSSTSPPLKE